MPLLVKDVPGALHPSDRDRERQNARNKGKGANRNEVTARGANGASRDGGGLLPTGSSGQALGGAKKGPAGPDATWQELDAKFRRDLPDEAYVGRLGYRGLVMRACPALRMLDGVEVGVKEREKAERLLKSVLDGASGGARMAGVGSTGEKR